METLDTKDKILKAAKTEFAERGFDGARMGSIAELADVNQALLHYHYKNKENLYLQVFEKFLGENKNKKILEVSEVIKNWFLNPDEELYAVIYLTIKSQFLLTDEELQKLLAKAFVNNDKVIRIMAKNYFFPHAENIKRIILKGIEQRVFETSHPELLILGIHTFAMNILKLNLILSENNWGDEKDSEHIFDHIIETTFKSLRPKEGDLKIPKLEKKKQDFLDESLKEILEEIEQCR